MPKLTQRIRSSVGFEPGSLTPKPPRNATSLGYIAIVNQLLMIHAGPPEFITGSCFLIVGTMLGIHNLLSRTHVSSNSIY